MHCYASNTFALLKRTMEWVMILQSSSFACSQGLQQQFCDLCLGLFLGEDFPTVTIQTPIIQVIVLSFLNIHLPPPPRAQRTLCPTNTSRSDRIFWGPN